MRISDLGLAVELKEGKTLTKGYAGTPGGSHLYRRRPIESRDFSVNVPDINRPPMVRLCLLQATWLQRCWKERSTTFQSTTSLWEWRCLSSWLPRTRSETGGRRSVTFHHSTRRGQNAQLCGLSERIDTKSVGLSFRLSATRWKSACSPGSLPIRIISVSTRRRSVTGCWPKRLIRGWVLRTDAVMRSELTHFSGTSTGGNWMQVPCCFLFSTFVSCWGLC